MITSDIIERMGKGEQGKRLKRLRTELGLTQVELARSIGICQEQLSRYERGRCAVPVRYLAQIFRVHNVDPAVFFGKRRRGKLTTPYGHVREQGPGTHTTSG